MIGKIIILIVSGFFIWAISQEIREKNIDYKKIKNLTVDDVGLIVLSIVFVFGFFWVLIGLLS